MNLSSGRGLGQPWLRGAAALATMVCLALLAACGGARRPLPRAREDPRACRGQLACARCMRSHGVPGFPDPTTISGGIGEPGGFTFDTAGLNLDQRSPRHHAAQQACQRLATHAKG
jgi:hypothetical protein